MINSKLFENINLEKYRHFSDIDHNEFHQESGKQHYRLLAYLSTLFDNSIILDIGTHKGASASALSYNSTNTVLTFDIENRISDSINSPKSIKNIKFNYLNLFDPEKLEYWKNVILESKLIFLDIDPHNGILEYEFYLWLKKNNYQGLLVLDDIWYFKNMRNNIWYKIESEYKMDITHLGHWSGTGVVQFTKKYDFEQIKNTVNPTKPTLVTAYYDLTKMIDASPDIKNRPKEHYLDSAYSTLCLDYDMVIYCEEENLEKIKSIRPERLHHRTKFICNNFDDYKIGDENFSFYRNKIKENRINKPYIFDNRNTPSYYLFCMSRYLMIKETIKNNPFNSEHFVWINICIERMGFNNLIHLEEVLTNIRDKFSTCHIDYQPESLVRNTNEYFMFGRCGMCSGFFTGNKFYFDEFCNEILNKFIKYTNEGYGHADEQLYYTVYYDRPYIFEFYYGDYFQMITNYKYIYENPSITIQLLIKRSLEDGKINISLDACRFIWLSYLNKKIEIDDNLLREYFNYYLKILTNNDEKTEINIFEIKSIYNEIKKRNINL